MDVFNELGELALGSRLKRLSDMIMKQGNIIYQQNNLDFEPKYFTLYYVLLQHESMGIMELSEQLGISHPSVIQLVKEMETKGWVISTKDKVDKRKRGLSLSKEAKAMAPELTKLWDDIAKAIHNVLTQFDNDFLNKIANIEEALISTSLASRVSTITARRKMEAVTIIDYKPSYSHYFKTINYAWIKKYFEIEEQDVKVLENPQSYIINNGGYILFAKVENQIAGTCALVNLGDNHYELSKMGVFENYQGHQIGKKLGLAVIEKAKSVGAKKISLDSNKRLKPAINLYQRLGFKTVHRTQADSLYERSNIYMELNLA